MPRSREPAVLFDAIQSVEAGVDSSKTPTLIGRNQVSWGLNSTFRGGYWSPRPAYFKQALDYADDTTQTRWLSGNFQGAEFFFRPTGDSFLTAMVGGRLFRIDPRSWIVTEVAILTSKTVEINASFTVPAVDANVQITVQTTSAIDTAFQRLFINGKEYTLVSIDSAVLLTITNKTDTPTDTVPVGTELQFTVIEPNPTRLKQAWSVQAENYVIYQDGESRGVIYDGGTARRAADDEVPVGKQMAYGNLRLWVALPDGQQFVAGDLANGPTGVLKFTENDFIAEGGAFFIPLSAGKLAGLTFTATPDTALGQGSLLVFAEQAVFSVDVPFDRDAWKLVRDLVQRVVLLHYGSLSQWSIANVNGDVFFRARDGLRSLILAVRNFGDWGNTPISTEMRRVFDDDAQRLLNYASAVVFDNRYLITASPAMRDGQWYHRGLVALDFHVLSSMGSKLPPIYDGLWTKFDILKVLKGTVDGVERCFVFGLNEDNQTELWELFPSSSIIHKFDNDDADDGRIHSVIETASFAYREPFLLKQLLMAEFWYDQLRGEIPFESFYRPDGYPLWVPWHEWSESAPFESCRSDDPNFCWTIGNPQAQYRNRRRLPTPDPDTDPITGHEYRRGYEFQFRFEFTGYARIRKIFFKAVEEEEDVSGIQEPAMVAEGTLQSGCLPQDIT